MVRNIALPILANVLLESRGRQVATAKLAPSMRYGRLGGYWELRLGPWDVAAGSLLVEQAGGRVTN